MDVVCATSVSPEQISCDYTIPRTVRLAQLNAKIVRKPPSKMRTAFGAIKIEYTATQRIGSFAVDVTLRITLLSDNTVKRTDIDWQEMQTYNPLRAPFHKGISLLIRNYWRENRLG
jgi:hypothetical protein